jgi:hypothetical protein
VVIEDVELELVEEDTEKGAKEMARGKGTDDFPKGSS